MKKIEARAETITPEVAQRIIDRTNKATTEETFPWKQRPLSDHRVEMYMRDMRAGRWDLNGESIILNDDGLCLDGWTRLHACVKAGVPFECIVVRGVSDEAFWTINVGRVRSGGAQLGMAKKTDPNNLNYALSVIWRYEQGDGYLTSAAWNKRPSRQELYKDVLARHPEIATFLYAAGTLRHLISAGLAAALWYLFAQKDRLLAEAFFEGVRTGENLNGDDPVRALRERLYKDRSLVAHHRPKPPMVAELVIRGWNAVRKGKPLTKMQSGRGVAETGQVRVAIL